MKKILFFIKFFIYLISLFFYGNTMAYDENSYKVVKKTDIYEIRHYPERYVAQATYSRGENGFRKLFRYITGSNASTQEISMTTPVTEEEKAQFMTTVGNSYITDKPEFVIILAWHLKNRIIKLLRKKGYKGGFIIPLPKLEILKN